MEKQIEGNVVVKEGDQIIEVWVRGVLPDTPPLIVCNKIRDRFLIESNDLCWGGIRSGRERMQILIEGFQAILERLPKAAR